MSGIDFSKLAKKSTVKPDKKVSKLLDFLNTDIKLFGNGLSDKKKEEFYHELNILLTAGVDIKTTLELIASEQAKEKDKELIAQIKNGIINGSTLSEAVKASGQFTSYEYHSLQIGEESGKIAYVLKELTVFYKKKLKQRRQIISALTYPSIVLIASFGAVFFMMNFIVPMFADVFKRFGGDLPVLTKVILNISQLIRQYFWMFLLLMTASTFLIYKQKDKDWFRNFSSKLVLKIPLFGEMIRKIYLARFSHSMSLLIGSKIPLLKSVALIKQMIGFYPIETSLDAVEADIMKGNTLHHALSNFPIYPQRMVSLVKVGEEVNQLEGFFDKIANQYTDEVEYQTSMISSLIEPFMIIFLGLIVGIILIAMYLPLFNLSSTI
jgi:type IV pilus assembly protein PilC